MLRQEYIARLAAVDAWMSSPAYPDVQAALQKELTGLDTSILATAPQTPETVAMLNLWHGQRQSLIAQLSYFEGLRNALKTQIDQMDEEGTIVASTEETTKTQNET